MEGSEEERPEYTYRKVDARPNALYKLHIRPTYIGHGLTSRDLDITERKQKKTVIECSYCTSLKTRWLIIRPQKFSEAADESTVYEDRSKSRGVSKAIVALWGTARAMCVKFSELVVIRVTGHTEKRTSLVGR